MNSHKKQKSGDPEHEGPVLVPGRSPYAGLPSVMSLRVSPRRVKYGRDPSSGLLWPVAAMSANRLRWMMNRLLVARRGAARRPRVLPPVAGRSVDLLPWSCCWLFGGAVAAGLDADRGVVAFGAVPFTFGGRAVPAGMLARGTLAPGRPLTIGPVLSGCGPPLAPAPQVLLETPATNVWSWRGGLLPSVGRPGGGGVWICTGCNREFAALGALAAHWAEAGAPGLSLTLRAPGALKLRPYLHPRSGVAAPAGVYTPRTWSGPSTGATAALHAVRARLLKASVAKHHDK